jgi:hypothetical protein
MDRHSNAGNDAMRKWEKGGSIGDKCRSRVRRLVRALSVALDTSERAHGAMLRLRSCVVCARSSQADATHTDTSDDRISREIARIQHKAGFPPFLVSPSAWVHATRRVADVKRSSRQNIGSVRIFRQ